jgi:hypothetical protein
MEILCMPQQTGSLGYPALYNKLNNPYFALFQMDVCVCVQNIPHLKTKSALFITIPSVIVSKSGAKTENCT